MRGCPPIIWIRWDNEEHVANSHFLPREQFADEYDVLSIVLEVERAP